MSTGVYTKTFGDICRDALRDAGIVAAQLPITQPHFQLAQSKANDVLAAWQGLNIHLWAETEALLPLNPDQTEYSLGVGGDHCFTEYTYTTATAAIAATAVVIPCATTGMSTTNFIGIALEDGTRHWSTISSISTGVSVTIADALPSATLSGAGIYVYSAKIDRPVRIIGGRGATTHTGDEKDLIQETRESYFKIVNKLDRSSSINSWYYSPQLTVGKLYVWQAPEDCNQILRFTFVKPQYVNQDQTETVLIPAEWLLAFKWAVAYELAVTYGIDPNRLISIAQKAESSLSLALGNDEEYDSFSFQPG